MKYAILIYGDEASAPTDPVHMKGVMEAYQGYNQKLEGAGVMKGGEALQSTSTATTVRVKGGKKTVTHGPFAETKEQLLGFYLLDCPHLDAAVEWGAQCPGAQTGTIEVRPVWENWDA